MSEKAKKKLPDSDIEKNLGFEVKEHRRRHYISASQKYSSL